MARQDISMDTHLGEMLMSDNRASKTIYPFSFLGEIPGQDNEHYCYGEVLIPVTFKDQSVSRSGIHVHIPYIPNHRMLNIRLRFDLNSDAAQYLINKRNNTIYFPIISNDYGSLPLSTFLQKNENGEYHLILHEGNFILYSGSDTDVIVKPSLNQTETFLLKSFAGNMYQNPETGVGLMDYLHGNFATSGLPGKLLSEFKADKMNVNNANMDSDSGEIYLDVTEYE